MEINTVILSLGSNLGNGIDNILETIQLLCEENTISIIKTSSYYQTEALGFESDHLFTNNCIEISTELNPKELLNYTKEVEKKLGRIKKPEYSDRIIDIDILFYKDLIITNENLSIPHPRWKERNFVLYPLLDLLDQITVNKVNYQINIIIEELSNEDKSKIIKLKF